MINRTEFIKELAERTGNSQVAVRELVSAMGDLLMDYMAEHETVTPFTGIKFIGFVKEAHIATNPRTGEKMEIPAKNSMKVHISPSAKQSLN